MVVKTRIVGACLWASRLMAATAAGFELGQRMRAVTKLVDRARQTSLWRRSKWGKQKLKKGPKIWIPISIVGCALDDVFGFFTQGLVFLSFFRCLCVCRRSRLI